MTDEPRKLVKFTRLDQIKPVALQAVIDGILFENTIGGIVGKSGSCKSFLAQGMAACVATGTPWIGRDVEPGGVFYIGGEGQAGIRKRFEGWSTYTGISLIDAPIYVADSLPALHDPLNVAGIIDEISVIADELLFNAGGMEPKLVIVDTLARAMGGADENSASDMGRLIQGLDWMRDAWKCCVQVIHHTGHGSDTAGRARGSSAYYAALDSELLVISDGGPVTVRTTKAKDWTPCPEIILDRHLVDVDMDGQMESTLVLSHGVSTDARRMALEVRGQVAGLMAEGVSVREIAKRLGITKGRVEHQQRLIRREANDYARASSGH